MKQFLTITEAEDKKTAQGKPYVRFKTNQGWMTCFDSDVITSIKSNLHKQLELETLDSLPNSEGRTFTSIKNMWAVAGDEVIPKVMTETQYMKASGSNQISIEKKDTKLASICVSYAKDMIIAGEITHE